MDATTTFSLGFAQVSESKAETTDWLLDRQTLQRIATRMSLICQALGFSIFGTLMPLNRHQADLSGLTGGNVVAIIGGKSAILVGAVFLGAVCLHWRFCARHPATLPIRHQSTPFLFLEARASDGVRCAVSRGGTDRTV
jgi:hypothetical protein